MGWPIMLYTVSHSYMFMRFNIVFSKLFVKVVMLKTLDIQLYKVNTAVCIPSTIFTLLVHILPVIMLHTYNNYII